MILHFTQQTPYSNTDNKETGICTISKTHNQQLIKLEHRTFYCQITGSRNAIE